MARLTEEEFKSAMRPVLDRIGARYPTLADWAKDPEARRDPLGVGEFLLLVAAECRQVYSRREKNYE